MTVDRRSLLKYAALAPLASGLTRLTRGADSAVQANADYTLRIASGLVELSPKTIVSTTLYNGQSWTASALQGRSARDGRHPQ